MSWTDEDTLRKRDAELRKIGRALARAKAYGQSTEDSELLDLLSMKRRSTVGRMADGTIGKDTAEAIKQLQDQIERTRLSVEQANEVFRDTLKKYGFK